MQITKSNRTTALTPWLLPRTICVVALASKIATAQHGPAAPADPAPSSPAEYRRAVLAANGNAAKGQQLFNNSAKTQCAKCHPVGGVGPSLAPDLTGLGGGRISTAEILDAILEPSAKIHPDYASTVVALKSGQVLQGLLRPINDTEIEIVTSTAQTVRVSRSEIDQQSPSPVSLMPAGLYQTMSPPEMADLITYLRTLEPPRSGAWREAIDTPDIPIASSPVSFRPIPYQDAPFHRPVWFGPLPGHPATSVVIEMQRARIWTLDQDGGKRSLFADVINETTPGEFTGLMSMAFHPDFTHNRRYFLKLHTPRIGDRTAVQVIERKATPDGLRDSGQPSKLILKIPIFSETHNGGHLAFGPDNLLYIAMGDTGPQGDPLGHSQDLTNLFGKMSRIDIDPADATHPYAIPPDNPFRKTPSACPEIWALGLRAPWRFSFDPPTGDLWIGDVGQGLYEEVTIARAGENHGWNVFEGFRPYSNRYAKPSTTYVPPVFAYHHRIGVSVTGGFVYRGHQNQALAGKYIFGDYETRKVWALTQHDRRMTSIIEIGRAPDKIASFGLDSHGEIHVVGLENGLIHQIDTKTANLNPAPRPREPVTSSP
jgi:putative heme-binding domain-containing protein